MPNTDVSARKPANKVHEAALMRCIEKLRKVSEVDGKRAPCLGDRQNKWIYCSRHDWVASFRVGGLWLAYGLTGDEFFRDRARIRDFYYEELLITPEWQDHDLGFLFSLSCVADFKLTGRLEARDRALAGASLLASRFVSRGGYILAWHEGFATGAKEKRDKWAAFVKNRMIADSMENLALLFWAGETLGDPEFSDIALAHARTTQKLLVREDGTSFHTFAFEGDTGIPRGGATHQGYSDSSCWSRGQAWLIHGFTQVYKYSGKEEFLDTARKVAHRFETLLGDRGVPLWDFNLPEHEEMLSDSSAGAIAAAGVLSLAGCCSGAEAAHWADFGGRLIDGLLAECDLTFNNAAHGFLSDGAANVPAGRKRSMLPYGDYYFLEALMRSTNRDGFFW